MPAPDEIIVICVVTGGVLTDVRSSVPVTVKVLDYDNDQEDEKELEYEFDNLPHIAL